MRTRQDDYAIDRLLVFLNRYAGPNANRVAPDCYKSAEAIHHDSVTQKLTGRALPTHASFKAVCHKFIEWCEKDDLNTDLYKFFAHPATKVAAFLESERQRHIQQGTQPGINVANAFTEVVKLSTIQECPSFENAEIDHKKAVVVRAKNDSIQQNCSAELDYSKTRADRAVLTDEDIENFLETCAQQGAPRSSTCTGHPAGWLCNRLQSLRLDSPYILQLDQNWAKSKQHSSSSTT